MFVKDLAVSLKKEHGSTLIQMCYEDEYILATGFESYKDDDSGISFLILTSIKKDKKTPLKVRDLSSLLKDSDPFALIQISYDNNIRTSVTNYKRNVKDDLGRNVIIMTTDRGDSFE